MRLHRAGSQETELILAKSAIASPDSERMVRRPITPENEAGDQRPIELDTWQDNVVPATIKSRMGNDNLRFSAIKFIRMFFSQAWRQRTQLKSADGGLVLQVIQDSLPGPNLLRTDDTMSRFNISPDISPDGMFHAMLLELVKQQLLARLKNSLA